MPIAERFSVSVCSLPYLSVFNIFRKVLRRVSTFQSRETLELEAIKPCSLPFDSNC